MSYLDNFTTKTGTDNRHFVTIIDKLNFLVIGATNFFEFNFKLPQEFTQYSWVKILIVQGEETKYEGKVSTSSVVKIEDFYQVRYILSWKDSLNFEYNYLQCYAQIQFVYGDTIVYSKRLNLKVVPLSGDPEVIYKYVYYEVSESDTPSGVPTKLMVEDLFKQNGAKISVGKKEYLYFYLSFDNGGVETYAIQWWTPVPEYKVTLMGKTSCTTEDGDKDLYVYRIGPHISKAIAEYRVVDNSDS